MDNRITELECYTQHDVGYVRPSKLPWYREWSTPHLRNFKAVTNHPILKGNLVNHWVNHGRQDCRHDSYDTNTSTVDDKNRKSSSQLSGQFDSDPLLDTISSKNIQIFWPHGLGRKVKGSWQFMTGYKSAKLIGILKRKYCLRGTFPKYASPSK